MAKLKAEDIAAVKGRGFLINRGTDCFSGRIVAPGTVFTAEDFENIAALSAKYGSGKLLCTSRMAVEIPGISFENIPAAESFAAAHGLRFGGTGAKVRPVQPGKQLRCGQAEVRLAQYDGTVRQLSLIHISEPTRH